MPPEGDVASMAQGAGNNSSDFVSLAMISYSRPRYRADRRIRNLLTYSIIGSQIIQVTRLFSSAAIRIALLSDYANKACLIGCWKTLPIAR